MNARGCTLWYFLQWIIAVDDRTSIASAPQGDMTSPGLNELIRFLWFSYDFAKNARAGNLQNYCEKALGFWGFYVEMLANKLCLVGFWHERARVHFVVFFAIDYRRGRQDVHRECAARWHDIAGFHQNLKIPMVFLWFQQERPGRNFAKFLCKSIWFLMLLRWNACKHIVFGMILT